eukprot:1175667-Prorocentrum_minimum.AAC.5
MARRCQQCPHEKNTTFSRGGCQRVTPGVLRRESEAIGGELVMGLEQMGAASQPSPSTTGLLMLGGLSYDATRAATT